jgi:acyl-CoA thioesterase
MSEAKARVADLARRDCFMRLLGAELLEAGPGTAMVRAVVGPEHINFNGTCHGGFTFALADTAFGLASNSRGEIAIGIDAHVAYIAAAREGDALTATAKEISRSRRIGTYEIVVHKSGGRQIARFTGTVFIPAQEKTEA